MSKNLVIVESPSKSKTIEKYLGKDYKVVSSKGHIRDLATTGQYGLGVDIENGFKPNYIPIKGKGKIIKELKTYYGDDISMINNGSKILYWNMSEKYKKNLKKTIKDLLGQKDGQKYAYLTVITECNDEDKEIVQVIL